MSAEIIERLAGRRVIASISGGKDSAAMSLYLRELGIEHGRVFLDTGWEHALTYEYLRGPLTECLGPIVEVRGPLDMEALAIKKGIFPSRLRRYCTTELKVLPMQRHLAALVDGGADVVNAVGIRAAESAARAKLAEWEWSESFDCETWRPLIHWTDQEVIDIHTRHGLRPNPLYLMGARRVGCWPCIYARKEEIRLVADTDPGRIERIRDLEERVTARATEITAARGEELKSARSWFRSPAGDGETWGIDRVVKWSRTSRGGGDSWRCSPPTRRTRDACAGASATRAATRGTRISDDRRRHRRHHRTEAAHSHRRRRDARQRRGDCRAPARSPALQPRRAPRAAQRR